MKKRLTTAAMAATMAFSTFGGINVFANETKSVQEETSFLKMNFTMLFSKI